MTDLPTFRLITGDCLEAMAEMDEASVDAIVTDPPYGLEFMGKEWDRLDTGRNAVRWDGKRTAAGTPEQDPETPASRHGASVSPSRPNPRCGNCGHYRFSGTPCECIDPSWEARANEQAQRMQTWHQAWATQALRVLKPGGHLLAFGGTRTYHRLACAIEDAGFEIRDCLAWMYGSGFPKSLDVSKAIDKAAGAEREVVGTKMGQPGYAETAGTGRMLPLSPGAGDGYLDITAPATPEAQRWQGWGTALKPAYEPIVLARKPLVGTVAANVLAHGTGALNVDGTRIETDGRPHREARPTQENEWEGGGQWKSSGFGEGETTQGRWPANVLLGHAPGCKPTDRTRKVKTSTATSGQPQGGQIFGWQRENDGARGYADEDGTETVPVWDCVDDCAVAMLDEQTGETTYNPAGQFGVTGDNGTIYGGGEGLTKPGLSVFGYGDRGGASRFFYTAKASSAERNRGVEWMEPQAAANAIGDPDSATRSRGSRSGPRQNVHPTVKPVDLMQWLCRLITPPGGTVLDPFTGSGSTGIAALREGFEFIGIEREPEYVEIARARIVGDAPLFNVEA
jgi:DNA modification methylase